jgi:hypothetical protein
MVSVNSMAEQPIVCPNCGHKIFVTAALRQGVEEQVRKELDREFAEKQKTISGDAAKQARILEKREKELSDLEKSLDARVAARLKTQTAKVEESIRRRVQDELSNELQERDEKLESIQAKLRDAQKREADLKTHQREIADKVRENVRKEVEDEVSNEIRERDEKLERIQGKLREAQKKESDLRIQQQELDEQRRELDLQLQRKLAERTTAIEDKVRAQEATRWEESLRERDEQLDRMRVALTRAQRTGSSGELKGDVSEQSLEARLRQAFPEDRISRIQKGTKGADILQHVEGGGSILWESKNVMSWSKEWVPKLKRDRDAEKASVGILVTVVEEGSKPVKEPHLVDGVVLTSAWAAIGVASLLRPQIAEIEKQRLLYDQQGSLQATVYAWVTSQPFRRGLAAIYENLKRLEQRLEGARRANDKWFGHLDSDVDRSMRALGEFYGSLQAHNVRLPELSRLALPPGTPPVDGLDAIDDGPPKGEGGTDIAEFEDMSEPPRDEGTSAPVVRDVECIACRGSVPLTSSEVSRILFPNARPRFEKRCPNCSMLLAIAWRNPAHTAAFSIRLEG